MNAMGCVETAERVQARGESGLAYDPYRPYGAAGFLPSDLAASSSSSSSFLRPPPPLLLRLLGRMATPGPREISAWVVTCSGAFVERIT